MTTGDLIPGEGTTVYAAVGRDGETLYVGQTGNLSRRIAEHRRNAAWFPFAVEVQAVRECPDRGSARDLERYLIRACHSRFNVQHGEPRAAREWRDLATAATR